MTNKQEMSKGLRKKLWHFFSFSYTHYTLKDLLKEIHDDELFDRDNEHDTLALEDLWCAHEALACTMEATFGSEVMDYLNKDNDAKGKSV